MASKETQERQHEAEVRRHAQHETEGKRDPDRQAEEHPEIPVGVAVGQFRVRKEFVDSHGTRFQRGGIAALNEPDAKAALEAGDVEEIQETEPERVTREAYEEALKADQEAKKAADERDAKAADKAATARAQASGPGVPPVVPSGSRVGPPREADREGNRR